MYVVQTDEGEEEEGRKTTVGRREMPCLYSSRFKVPPAEASCYVLIPRHILLKTNN